MVRDAPDDARALTHLENVLGEKNLLEKAASKGDSLAMGLMLLKFEAFLDCQRRFQLAHAAAEQGDATGTYFLAKFVEEGCGCEKDEWLGYDMVGRAVEMGSFEAYSAILSYQEGASQKLRLMTSFFGISIFSVRFNWLEMILADAFRCFSEDGSCCDAIRWAGELLKESVDEEGGFFGCIPSAEEFSTFQRAIEMYDCWRNAVEEMCVAWVLIGKRMELIKDVRRMIAKMVWEAGMMLEK